MTQFERLIAIRLVSHDAAALAGFYCAALGFKRVGVEPISVDEMALLGVLGSGWRTILALAGQALEIDQFDPPGRSYPTPAASDNRFFQHFAMITTDISAAWARVLAAGGRAISASGPVQLPPVNGSVRAVKFRDPEGHPLELLAFPDGTPRPLAIDHSAIVVRDVAASLAFYQSRGLSVGVRTLNHGPAQAALDGLPDPHVDVVPLNPRGGGPHLELLGYRDPAPRPPEKWQPRDVAATRLVWEAAEAALIADLDGHFHQFQPRGTPRASPPESA